MSKTLHLTEEQIDDLLIGDAAAESQTHLAECGACRTRLAQLRAPIESFAAMTLAWSERQSATMMPQPFGTTGSPWSHRLNWALAAAVLVAVGFVLPIATRRAPGGNNLAANDAPKPVGVMPAPAAQPVQPEVKIRAVVVRTSEDQVARDNQMLQNINDELDASVPSPADAFGLVNGGRTNGPHGRNAPAVSWD
jgi:hypothetical protein